MKNIEEIVDAFPTKYEQGFLRTEVEELLTQFQDVNMDKFNDALYGITAKVINGKTILYHNDIIKALCCGIKNRGLTVDEFD